MFGNWPSMRRDASQTSPAEKMTWFSCTPTPISSTSPAMRASSCQRAARDDRLEVCGSAAKRRLLDREAVRVGRGHDELVAGELDEDAGQHRARLVARSGASRRG